MSSHTTSKTALFLALSGIGNWLMQLPTIEAFKKARPDWRVVVWVAPRGTKALVQACSAVDTVIEGNPKRSLLRHAILAYRLARYKPDVAIMLSPGQLIKGAAHMFLAGAEHRVAHRYPHLGNPQSTFLLTDSVPEEAGAHDIEQNLHLLETLGIATGDSAGQPYHFTPPPVSLERGERLLRDLHIPGDKKIIGFHAGSASNFPWKRWPLKRFAHVARALITNHQAHILIFGGPDERQQSRELHRLIGDAHVSLVATDLLTAAAVMMRCRLFLTNDSGLMHLAAAVGTPTFGIFGPTDERTTGPRGAKSHVIRAAHTEPVYNTEANYSLGQEPHDTLLKIEPAMVLETLAKYL